MARPSNSAAAPLSSPIDPGQLYIPVLGVNAPMLSLGTEMSTSEFLGGKPVPSFGVPPDLSHTAWWSDGPAIGSDGMAIVLGHAQIGDGFGVFNDVNTLKPGAEVVVENPDASARVTFRVIKVVTGISKRDSRALQQTLERRPSAAGLALITCGGEADWNLSESDENVVVFAEKIKAG